MYYENLLLEQSVLHYYLNKWDCFWVIAMVILIAALLIRVVIFVINEDGNYDKEVLRNDGLHNIRIILMITIIISGLLCIGCSIKREVLNTKIDIVDHNILKYTMETTLKTDSENNMLSMLKYNAQASESNNKMAEYKFKNRAPISSFLIPDEIEDVEYIKLLGED